MRDEVAVMVPPFRIYEVRELMVPEREFRTEAKRLVEVEFVVTSLVVKKLVLVAEVVVLSVAMRFARVVLVLVRFVKTEFVEKRLVLDAEVVVLSVATRLVKVPCDAFRTEAKRLVEVAEVVVLFVAKRFVVFRFVAVLDALVVVAKVLVPETVRLPVSVSDGTEREETFRLVMFAVVMVEEATVVVAKVEVPETERLVEIVSEPVMKEEPEMYEEPETERTEVEAFWRIESPVTLRRPIVEEALVVVAKVDVPETARVP
jgi:hypothetical protein